MIIVRMSCLIACLQHITEPVFRCYGIIFENKLSGNFSGYVNTQPCIFGIGKGLPFCRKDLLGIHYRDHPKKQEAYNYSFPWIHIADFHYCLTHRDSFCSGTIAFRYSCLWMQTLWPKMLLQTFSLKWSTESNYQYLMIFSDFRKLLLKIRTM